MLHFDCAEHRPVVHRLFAIDQTRGAFRIDREFAFAKMK
jgi:hypothetical protein